MHAIMFLLIFAAVVVLYGFWLYKSGDGNLLPYRAQHSVRDERDVRYVGLVTIRVGLVLAVVLGVAYFFVR